MSTPRQEALALIAHAGAEMHEWGSDPDSLIGDVWTPPGAAWTATGCHVIAVNFHTGRPAGWRHLLADLRQGTEPCTDPGCQTCTGQAQ